MYESQQTEVKASVEQSTQTSGELLTAAQSAPDDSNIPEVNATEPNVRQDFASNTPTYMDFYSKNHRYHGFPEYNMMRGHRPVTQRDAMFIGEVKSSNANIPYGENVPTTLTDPRPYAGSLNERSSAEHRKFRRHQLEAENDILMFKEEKLRQLQLEQEEKKRDWEMLKNYDPYGKPGGGAPLAEGSRKNKYLNDSLHRNYSNEAGFKFGRPGAGAPLRTDSGRLKTEITGDPLIRFHQGKTLQDKQAIQESMRYVTKQEDGRNYQKQLDRQLAERAIADQEARIHELRAELDMLQHDPFGRPGAGAPNHGQDRELQQKYRTGPKHDEIWHPFGRARHGDHKKDENGNVVTIHGRQETEPASNTYPFMELTPESGRRRVGAPITTEGEHNAKLPITMQKNEFGDATIHEETPGQEITARESHIWYPIDKTRPGETTVDENGNNTTVHGRIHHELGSADERRRQSAAREYLNEIQQEMFEQRRNREAGRDYNRAAVGELARVIQDGHIGKPRRDVDTSLLVDQHLGMTDVTKQRLDYSNQKNDSSSSYHTELSRAAEERYRKKELEKLKDRQRCRMHEQVMNSFWGRPGGGAPNPSGYRYHDPLDTIHSPRRQNEAPQWEHTKNLSGLPKSTAAKMAYSPKNSPRASYDSPYKFKVRDTTHSTHKNQYEYELPTEPMPKKSYNLITPYALA